MGSTVFQLSECMGRLVAGALVHHQLYTSTSSIWGGPWLWITLEMIPEMQKKHLKTLLLFGLGTLLSSLSLVSMAATALQL